MALSFASKDTIWLNSILSPFHWMLPLVILLHNWAAVQISRNCSTQKNYWHIDCELNAINKLVYHCKVDIKWIGTEEQWADILTKALGWQKVALFVQNLGLLAPNTILASNGGKAWGGSNTHAPPAIVRLFCGPTSEAPLLTPIVHWCIIFCFSFSNQPGHPSQTWGLWRTQILPTCVLDLDCSLNSLVPFDLAIFLGGWRLVLWFFLCFVLFCFFLGFSLFLCLKVVEGGKVESDKYVFTE